MERAKHGPGHALPQLAYDGTAISGCLQKATVRKPRWESSGTDAPQSFAHDG